MLFFNIISASGSIHDFNFIFDLNKKGAKCPFDVCLKSKSDRDETVLRTNSIFDGKIPSGRLKPREFALSGLFVYLLNKERKMKSQYEI